MTTVWMTSGGRWWSSRDWICVVIFTTQTYSFRQN
ncbi:hypothetical protein BDL97_04G030700 [Sphagnum fallax]|nr:hypothetical protein BDL97_04G030700 [Sphagnum fallax]